MRIACPQSTLDVIGEAPCMPTAAAAAAAPTTNPAMHPGLVPRRAAPPIPHDRHPPATPTRARPHPYANTRARTAAAAAAANVTPTGAKPHHNANNDVNNVNNNVNNNANNVNNANANNVNNVNNPNNPNNNAAATAGPRRVPRMTNSARHVLHYNALHRESSARRMSMRPRARDAKLEKVEAARRKENLKKECAAKEKDGGAKRRRKEKRAMSNVKDYKYVYVGNLPTSITEARIQEFFTQNGVRDLDGVPSIRTTGGTVGAVVIPSELRTERDRRYACVRFKSHDSVYRALQLNETMFEGMEVVITIDPTNLPECRQILSSHMEEIAELKRMQLNMNGRRIRGIPSPLQLNDTEKSITTLLQQNTGGRFKVLGVSFAPCIS